MALRAKTETEETRRRVIESRLPVLDWPAGKLQITAVDALTGDLVVFDAASDVRLLDAVGASCAVPGIWPPVTINGRRYIDGGIRSAANADLAAGCERIVIVAPLVSGYGPLASPVNQARTLSEAGAIVTVIKPDKAALRAIGKNVLNPERRPAAAQAGYVQAESVAQEVKAVWAAMTRTAHGRAGPGGRSGPAQLVAYRRLCAQTAYSSSGCARLGWRSLDSDCFSSCLMRSLVRPSALPISSSVCGLPS